MSISHRRKSRSNAGLSRTKSLSNNGGSDGREDNRSIRYRRLRSPDRYMRVRRHNKRIMQTADRTDETESQEVGHKTVFPRT